MTQTQRQALNAARLLKTNEKVRPKFAAILKDLESHGWQPLIDAGVWRSPSEQLAKVKAGFSKVRWSFHNATTPDGKPDALAVDITDARWGWDSPKAFWLMLAASAEAHQLTTGIYWGLNKARRDAIHEAIAKRNFSNPQISTGWDEAHVEPKNLTITAARLGARPR
jgi:hypothetical protein